METNTVRRLFKVVLLIMTSETILMLAAIIQNHLYFDHHTCTEDTSGIVIDSAVVVISFLIFLSSIVGFILAVKAKDKKVIALFAMSFVFAIIVFVAMDMFVYFIKNCKT